ncbi:hypothetical protein [Nocardia terpenica]|uniref:DUF308 domain-containing protein n=1 Tax=Nocardia terpenica TaxID=455432 RepID=A0A6G9ZFE6_9NOCA|nr:hypothetical protein [Nocardia terpenica]QIS23713.1 hypothetical protein F6W96_40975 [Nocardia terpenica]
MDASNGRSRLSQGITAVIFGFFSLGWFGWGRDAPPGWLRLWLDIGTVLAAVVGIAGAAVCFRHRAADVPAGDPAARRRYGIIVGVEFGVAAALAVVLGVSGNSVFIPVAIAAVVGVHFHPLAAPLDDPGLQPLSLLTCMVAIAGLLTGLTTTVAPSAVVGPGVGILLTGYGALSLVRPARYRPNHAVVRS